MTTGVRGDSAARSTELTGLIDNTPWIDTHEHLVEESHRLRHDEYRLTDGLGFGHRIPGDWSALIVNYAIDDLVVAGLPAAQVDELLGPDRSPLEKWEIAAPYFELARATGYLRAVDLTTERLFGARLSAETCDEIDGRFRALRKEGYYRTILENVANVDRCQVHSLERDPYNETAYPELLEQDLSLVPLALGRHPLVEELAGIEVGSLDDYLEVMEACFDRFARRSVAVKCHWAYMRPLRVGSVGEPPRRSFARLRAGDAAPEEQREVEDFLFRRCLDLATQHRLPVKVHMGYLSKTRLPQFPLIYDHVPDILPLVVDYPDTDFVLMHMAWPQQEQLLAAAKHHPNVFVDLCWSWIVAPFAAVDFVQRFLTSVPANKLLCFGGDYLVVESVVGHAEIARRGLQAALEGLVRAGWLTGDDALALVPRLMRDNATSVLPRSSARVVA
jgi:hypothetical protein